MKTIRAHCSTLFRFSMMLFMAAAAVSMLGACERSEPTPDPAPAPPTPQTWYDNGGAGVHRAIFTYPGSGTRFMQPGSAGHKPVRT